MDEFSMLKTIQILLKIIFFRKNWTSKEHILSFKFDKFNSPQNWICAVKLSY